MKTTIIFLFATLALRASAVPVDVGSVANVGAVAGQRITISIDTGAPGVAVPGPAAAGHELFAFSSQHEVAAVPEEVVDGTTATGGLAGASGEFRFGLSTALNMICYNITLRGFTGDFASPASTATHIHEAARGASGPPRIAFPDPQPLPGGDPAVRHSAGCLQGPFLTGLLVDGVDSGEGFHVSMIEANPAAFMADTHSSLALPGAVRGQLA